MRYPPPHYTDTDAGFANRIMRENAFAVLIGPDLDATHLPLLLTEGGHLEGHVAKANPVAQQIGREALAIFSGPHGYVSATLYDDPGASVPTWNYTAVHARGVLRPMEEAANIPHLSAIAEQFESDTGWRPSDAPDYVARIRAGIVAFRLEVSEVRAFRKLSREKSPAIKKRIIDAARAAGDDAFADEMAQCNGAPG